MFAGYRQLLRARRTQPAFHPAAPQQVLDLGAGVFALQRGPRDGDTVVALHNVTAGPQTLDIARFGEGSFGVRNVLTGEAVNPDALLTLPPYGVRWLALLT